MENSTQSSPGTPAAAGKPTTMEILLRAVNKENRPFTFALTAILSGAIWMALQFYYKAELKELERLKGEVSRLNDEKNQLADQVRTLKENFVYNAFVDFSPTKSN